ncbi:hypothetical protein D3C84_835050 [compost metagenome]
MDHRVDFAQGDARLFGYLSDPLHYRCLGEGVVRQHLGGMQSFPYFHCHIGERTTDIHTNSDWLSVFRHHQLPTTRFYTLAWRLGFHG